MADQRQTTEPDTRSPEEVLAQFFVDYDQRLAVPEDARRTRPTRLDRHKAHSVVMALRQAGWRVLR